MRAHTATQDTFSFALVLLCLAAGDIEYVHKKHGGKSTAYCTGWRPDVRKSLRVACPEIAALIKEMWLADFRARPAMRDVVVRLEACTVVDGAAKSEAHPEEYSTSPQVDDQTGNKGLDRQSGDPAVATIAALRAENEAAKAEIEALKTANKAEIEAANVEIEALKAENDALKGRTTAPESQF